MEAIKITILRNICLPFTKKIVFWKKNIFFAAVWKSWKKIHLGSFQIDEAMAARFAT